MSESDVSNPTDFQPSLIGKFVFADELYFMQDEAGETVDGYLFALDVLVQRMLNEIRTNHSPAELESIENVNFYPVYNLASHSIRIEGTYWYQKDGEEVQGDFQLPLSCEEQADLKYAMEAYCVSQDSRNCMEMLNGFRAEDGLPPLPSKVDSLAAAENPEGKSFEDVMAMITAVAASVRKEMEQCYGEDLAGKCIAASEKIVARLSAEHGIAAKTVEGWCQFDDECCGIDRPWEAHTWAEISQLNLYIDVTADQFNFGMSGENEFAPVLVQEGLPHGMRYEEPSWEEYDMTEEVFSDDEVYEKKTASPPLTDNTQPTPMQKITRSPGLITGLGYIVGSCHTGFTNVLDAVVQKEAQLLRDHYGTNVMIRFNSDRLSGGAWIQDSEVDSFHTNDSIGLGASLMNSKLQAMSFDDYMNLSHHKLQELRNHPDKIQFETAIHLDKTINSVSSDSKHILMRSEYRDFDTLEDATEYLFSHAAGLREQVREKEPLQKQIEAAAQNSSAKQDNAEKSASRTAPLR